MKYTLISLLILTVVMLYFANKMLDVKKNMEKKIIGAYYSQMEEVNKETGMDIYNIDNKNDYEKSLEELKDIQ